MTVVRLYVWIIKIGLLLAVLGQLKTSTLKVMGLTADKTERGIIAYCSFSRSLTEPTRLSSPLATKARLSEKPQHLSP